MPTVILGSARDIVEHCGVPRFLFTDFPLGNPCGKPYDAEMQHSTVSHCFDVLEEATTAGVTVASPFQWDGDEAWRDRYLEVRYEDLVADPEARAGMGDSGRRWAEAWRSPRQVALTYAELIAELAR